MMFSSSLLVIMCFSYNQKSGSILINTMNQSMVRLLLPKVSSKWNDNAMQNIKTGDEFLVSKMTSNAFPFLDKIMSCDETFIIALFGLIPNHKYTTFWIDSLVVRIRFIYRVICLFN